MVNVFYFLFRVAVNISNSIKSNHVSAVVFNAASHMVKELSSSVWKVPFNNHTNHPSILSSTDTSVLFPLRVNVQL